MNGPAIGPAREIWRSGLRLVTTGDSGFGIGRVARNRYHSSGCAGPLLDPAGKVPAPAAGEVVMKVCHGRTRYPLRQER
jgi:hypothetical protein